jgi:hypothetical protein
MLPTHRFTVLGSGGPILMLEDQHKLGKLSGGYGMMGSRYRGLCDSRLWKPHDRMHMHLWEELHFSKRDDSERPQCDLGAFHRNDRIMERINLSPRSLSIPLHMYGRSVSRTSIDCPVLIGIHVTLGNWRQQIQCEMLSSPIARTVIECKSGFDLNCPLLCDYSESMNPLIHPSKPRRRPQRSISR